MRSQGVGASVDDRHDRIRSKADLARFRREDTIAAGYERVGLLLLARKPILRFIWTLRTVEYGRSCWRSPLGRVATGALRYYQRHQGIRLGFTIPEHVIGPGLSIAHWGTIILSPSVRIGARCRLHCDVNIGAGDNAPVIGDDCYIGPGAKLFGKLTIGDRVEIGANAVVTRSFPDDVVVVGIPARVLRPSTRQPQAHLPEARRQLG